MTRNIQTTQIPLTVGFFWEQYNNQDSKFPPYNFYVEDDSDHGYSTWVLELAVAGYAKERLSVQQDKQTLIIAATKDEVNKQYEHRGISSRAFEKKVVLGEYVEVKSVELVDGLLKIVLERNIPEAAKPKQFNIE